MSRRVAENIEAWRGSDRAAIGPWPDCNSGKPRSLLQDTGSARHSAADRGGRRHNPNRIVHIIDFVGLSPRWGQSSSSMGTIGDGPRSIDQDRGRGLDVTSIYCALPATVAAMPPRSTGRGSGNRNVVPEPGPPLTN